MGFTCFTLTKSILAMLLFRYFKLGAVLLIVLFGVDLVAQDAENHRINFIELGIDVIAPQGKFKTNLDKSILLGGQFSFLRQVSAHKPMFWGIEYGYTRYDARDEVFEEIIDFNFATFDYHTYANLQRLTGLLRFYPTVNFNGFEPFVEAQFGGKWLHSGTTKTLASQEDESSDFEVESSSWSWSYGASIGINKSLTENIYLNLRTSYLYGSRAKYLVDEDLPLEFSSADAFKNHFSPTPIYIFTAGVTFVIN
jgi:opacity protein-like surface antigen